MLDSTSLQMFGQGKWDAEKHGRMSRQWRKLHLAIDAQTGEILAHVLTGKDAGYITAVPGLARNGGEAERQRDRRRRL